MLRKDLTVHVTVIHHKNGTAASVDLTQRGEGAWGVELSSTLATATGVSKRMQGDFYDENIAVNLAVGRALTNLGQRMVRKGNRQVRDAADVAAAWGMLDKARRSQRRTPVERVLLPVEEIAERFGSKAAQVAMERRGLAKPARHAKPAKAREADKSER